MAGDETDLSDDEALARVKAALGVREVPKKAVKKAKPVKKAAPRKFATKTSKKAPAKKTAKKTAKPRGVAKRAAQKAALDNPEIPDEVSGTVEVASPAEVVQLDLDDPVRRAYSLMVQGVPWDEIALRCGYADDAKASGAVALYLQRGAIAADLDTNKARAEIALTTALLIKSAYWDLAMSGDREAAKLVLDANRDYFRMAGLEKTDGATFNSKQMFVITGGTEMAAELRQHALDIEERRHAELDGPPSSSGV